MLRAKAAGGRPCWGRESLLFIPFSQFPHALQHWHMVVRRQTPQGAMLQHITSGCFSSSQKTYKQTHTDPIQNIHIDKKIFAAPSHQKHCCSADSMYCVLLYRAIQASHVPPSTTCHKDLGRPHILRCWCFLCSSRSQSQVFGNRPRGTIRAAAASRQQ